ncbi:putative bifunctional diguanylate cyclase/phosphodiesterase [Anaerostipes sp.]|uniref:putative bifunctional diguanylate cyclase/phosphodiesterase n=1 Tax=Anaerostipes sp. TaxID=1872530 RepID=UPI0025C4FF4B|nr:bifunctional diguanylate cyclase/phosphodiesterase [Anaerostipes sp.]MBS7009533.1 bifunctional diguanylate cyclase/phosphodiesterase [Anaerostipes sp.]
MGDEDMWSRMILDKMDHMIYLTDMDSYQLLYINQFGKQLYKINDDKEYAGKMCYQVLQGNDSPCSFCTNAQLREHGAYTWLNHNQILDEYFVIKDKMIQKDGRNLRVETAYNVTSTEQQKKELESKLINEETLIRCIKTLEEITDMETAIHKLLEIIAKFYDGDCAYIFEADIKNHVVRKTYEWCTEQGGCYKDQTISETGAKKWMELLQCRGGVLITENDRELDKEKEAYEILKLRNVSSVAAVPLTEKQRFTGFIGVDHPKNNTQGLLLLKSVASFVLNDIQKRRMMKKLEQMSYIDNLTGLENRNKYFQVLQELEEYPAKNLGVVFLNLNGLKLINDSYGQKYGDRLICNAASVLSGIFEEYVYRTGGDEFVVLCPGISREKFEYKMTELRKETEHNQELNVSMGAVWDSGKRGIKEQISYAEDLMYIEKQSYYKKTLNVEYNRRSAIAKKLIRDVERGRFVVYLQPKVEIETGRIIGAEALVRKTQKNGTLIMPDSFIPIYELENVISHVDLFVLEEACRIIRQWEQTAASSLTVSVNLSRVTLMEKDIVNRILDVCRRYQVEPSKICIEITESSSKIRLEELSRLAGEIIEAGFKISLDDYGTKYSNLAILSAIDFNEIKLDKSLIEGLETNEKSQVLVRYVILMCRTLNHMIPIAEGIETEGQIDILKNLGCSFGQGYYFSKPISVSEFFQRYLRAEAKGR